MGDGIYTALSGAIGRQRQLDQVSHNLANADTAGFRQTRQAFQENLVDAERGVHRVTSGDQIIDLTPGRIQETGNNLDLAISGPGFFRVKGPNDNEPILTRNGNFRITNEGMLVTQQGQQVLDEGGSPIQLMATPDEILIGEAGDVWDAFGMVATVGVVNVQDPRQLEAVDGGFRTNAQNLMPASGGLIQGSLERGNINPVNSMTEMITLQRHFEAMNNLIQTHNRSDSVAIESLGRI